MCVCVCTPDVHAGACKLSMSASSFDQITEMADDADGICHHALNRHDEPMLRFGQLEQSNRRKYLSYPSALVAVALAVLMSRRVWIFLFPCPRACISK